MTSRVPTLKLFPYTTLFRSRPRGKVQRCPTFGANPVGREDGEGPGRRHYLFPILKTRERELEIGNAVCPDPRRLPFRDRKSTRLNSSHITISYAVFCLKKKT